MKNTVLEKKELIEVWVSPDGYKGDLDCISWDENLYNLKNKLSNNGLGDEKYLIRKLDNKPVAIVFYWFGDNGKGKISHMKIQSLDNFQIKWNENNTLDIIFEKMDNRNNDRYRGFGGKLYFQKDIYKTLKKTTNKEQNYYKIYNTITFVRFLLNWKPSKNNLIKIATSKNKATDIYDFCFNENEKYLIEKSQDFFNKYDNHEYINSINKIFPFNNILVKTRLIELLKKEKIKINIHGTLYKKMSNDLYNLDRKLNKNELRIKNNEQPLDKGINCGLGWYYHKFYKVNGINLKNNFPKLKDLKIGDIVEIAGEGHLARVNKRSYKYFLYEKWIVERLDNDILYGKVYKLLSSENNKLEKFNNLNNIYNLFETQPWKE